MLVERIKSFCTAVGADIKALWAAVNGKMPRRGLYVNHGNSTERRYYLIGRITNNNGSFRVKGLIGGHDINTQGGGAVDLSIHSRAGNIPIVGFVAGNMGLQDLQVYKSATSEVFIYLVSGQYGLTDLEYSETLGGTVYFSPGYSLDTPAETLIFSAAAVAPGLGRVRMIGGTQVPPSTAGSAGFNLPPGVVVSSPRDGDLWSTPAGLYFHLNGVTQVLGARPAVFGFSGQPNVQGLGRGLFRDNAY